MASIYQKGRKHYVIYCHRNYRNERKQIWEPFNSYDDALIRKTEIEYHKRNGLEIIPTVMSVKDFFVRFVENYGKHKWCYSTLDHNMQILNRYVYPYLGLKPLHKVTPMDIECHLGMLRSMKSTHTKFTKSPENERSYLSEHTVKHVYNLLSKGFSKAVQWQLIRNSPVLCEPPRLDKVEAPVWSPENFVDVFAQIDNPILRLAVHLSYVCSLRSGEALALQWEDIDLDNMVVRVNKTLQRVSKEAIRKITSDKLIYEFPNSPKKKSTMILKYPKTKGSIRSVLFLEPVKQELLKRKEAIDRDKQSHGSRYKDYNLVLSLDNGNPIEPKLLQTWFRRWQESTTIPLLGITFHGVRHSSASIKMILAKGDCAAVSRDTGHSSKEILLRTYTHAVPSYNADLASQLGQRLYGNPQDYELQVHLGAILKMAQGNPNIIEHVLGALNNSYQ